MRATARTNPYPLLRRDVAEAPRCLEQAGVIGLATRTALEVDGRPGEDTSRIFPGELQLDIGVEDLLAGGATGVSLLGAQQVVEVTKIGHRASSPSRTACPLVEAG